MRSFSAKAFSYARLIASSVTCLAAVTPTTTATSETTAPTSTSAAGTQHSSTTGTMSYNLHGPNPPPMLSAAAKTKEKKTLRLTYPSWQGGTLPLYHFGSQLLTALAPPTNGPVAQVTVTPPELTPLPLKKTKGINALPENVATMESAIAVCKQHNPDNIVVLGGDCFAELGPFSYLADKYKKEKFGLLWLDAHPDVLNSKDWCNAHTYPVGALMGKGDKEFVELVKSPIPGSRVMVAGMHHPSKRDQRHIDDYGVRVCGPDSIVNNGAAEVLKWIKDEGITHLAIHLDLDVLSDKYFRMLYFSDPDAPEGAHKGVPRGQLRFKHVTSLLKAVSAKTQVVGFGITELLPWDVYNFREFLKELPLVNPNYAAKL
ncbi:arginase [Leptomonas pyrrhocoris]|uniref:Arginase n=1 Tax=Leptomonas pyrrhocoris TaxID=157538 RepID=A0A0M9G9D3_LEPPY|nr:arginase [Leptomonas pyrrhocoris]KPA85397.1 arginase [Leptomonas pyrrhocoris]|eukprot:XP_015663836.1 arginase [Leptomonas pyrrhocoris]